MKLNRLTKVKAVSTSWRWGGFCIAFSSLLMGKERSCRVGRGWGFGFAGKLSSEMQMKEEGVV